jgi:hypothetical protein
MNNLSLAVSADVTDLVTKSAIAKAEVRALTSEMNNLAKASAAGMGPEVAPALQQVAGELVRAKSEAAALSAEMKEMQGASVNVGEAVEEMGAKMTRAMQFAGIALATEGFRMLSETIEQVGEKAQQILTSADVLDVTGDQFQAMQHAAEDAGVGVDVLTRAAEKMNVTLFEARQGAGAAIEKLLNLGVTTSQINDPTFKLNDLLQTLHDRLTDTSTSQQTMIQLTADLGNRAALAAEALKTYDGSAEGVAEVMRAINGTTEEQNKELSEAKARFHELGEEAHNAGAKLEIFFSHMLPHADVDESFYKRMIDEDRAETQRAANEEQELNRVTTRQEMENAKAGVEAYKQGTQEKLDQLKIYAAAAAKYLGSDSADIVVKANQAIIAEQTAVTEHQQSELQKQRAFIQEWGAEYDRISNEVKRTREQDELEIAKAVATEVKEEKAQLEELVNWADKNYTEQTNRKAAGLREMAALDQKGAKEEVSAWKGVVGEIESAEGTMVSNILSKRKGLGQSLLALGSQLVTSEISNDVRAVTTQMALHNTAAAQQKALEQGGLLYHAGVELQKTLAVARSQTAQTGATVTGNTVRTTSTMSAAAASKAASSEAGSKTVLQDAAKAFSGTYASVAQIPYVGWILAPIAASASYAGVAAYEGLASLDTGTNYVPRDQLAQIHEGEAVIPKQYNPAANPAMAAAGAGYSEEHNYHGDINVSSFDPATALRMLSRPGMRNAVVASAMKSLRRGAR